MKSVCRQRNAGVCSTSTTAATGATCSALVHVGQHRQAGLAAHLGEDREPLVQAEAAERRRPTVRFALSKDDL